MRFCYRLLLAVLLAAPFLSFSARAQQPALPAAPAVGTGSFSGTVLDSLGGKPVSYATVVLLPVDAEKAITGVAADDDGKFTITKLTPGPYRLRVSYVGYGTRTRAVTATAGATSVGAFRLPTAATALNEAVVVGQKPVVEVRPDRLVYNAEQDITNAGGTATDVLRKAPLLAVDGEGKVTMRGSSNFRVLINNKPSPTLASNLTEALKGIPADQIKNIEIITTPPAKYDGEGTAGIINIVLKKGVDRGLNGRVGLSGGNRGGNLNGSLNFKKGKIGFSSSLGAGGWYNPSEFTRERTDFFVRRPDNQQPAQLSQRGDGRSIGGWVYGSVALDFDPAEHHSFSLASSINQYGGNSEQDLFNQYQAGDPALNQLYVRDTKSIFGGFTGEVTGTYTRTFAQARREWSVLGQASRTNGRFGYDFDQFNGPVSLSEEQASYRERSRGRTPGAEYTLQTDFTQPLTEKQTLEMGLKSIWRRTGSVADVLGTTRDVPGSSFVDLPGRATDFDYDQNVQAAYATYSFSPAKKLNLTLGGRAERTSLQASLSEQDIPFTSYTSLLPNGNAQYAYSDATSFRLAYSRRITRPYIYYLNPFVNRADSLNLSVGNPRLDPELTDSYELSYNTLIKTTSLNVTASARRTGNAIEGIRLPASEVTLPSGEPLTSQPGVTVQTYQNVAANSYYQLNAYVSAKPVKGWDLSGGPTVEYVVRRSPALGITRRGVAASLNFNTSYQLPKEFTISAFMFGGLPSVELQGRGPANFYYALGLKKTFFDKKADLVLNVSSPFNSYWPYRFTLDTPAFREEQEYRAFQRGVRLSFSYRFGQAQQTKQRKSISNDDVKGGGSQQGGQ